MQRAEVASPALPTLFIKLRMSAAKEERGNNRLIFKDSPMVVPYRHRPRSEGANFAETMLLRCCRFCLCGSSRGVCTSTSQIRHHYRYDRRRQRSEQCDIRWDQYLGCQRFVEHGVDDRAGDQYGDRNPQSLRLSDQREPNVLRGTSATMVMHSPWGTSRTGYAAQSRVSQPRAGT